MSWEEFSANPSFMGKQIRDKEGRWRNIAIQWRWRSSLSGTGRVPWRKELLKSLKRVARIPPHLLKKLVAGPGARSSKLT